MGTIINAIAVVVASILGIIFRKFLSEKFRLSIMNVLGVGLLLLSIGWFIKDFIVLEGAQLSTRFDMVVLLSLVIGAAVGEIIDIDRQFSRLVAKIENRFKLPPLTKGFVSASLLFCVGTLAIIGSFQDGISGDASMLLLKSTLDFITAMMLAAVMGIGVAFSALSILIYQGALTLFANLLSPYLVGDLLIQLTLVGNALLVAMALNFLDLKLIKVANWLPSLLGPVIYQIILAFIAR